MYYHGAIPLDFYYICSHILLYKGRLINAVGDRFLFKVPGKNDRPSELEMAGKTKKAEFGFPLHQDGRVSWKLSE